MAILGIITDLGLSTAQDAANNEGFNLVPVSFGVSDQAGLLDPARTTPNAGLFFAAAISSRVIIDQNTIKFVLTIPPGQIPTGTTKTIREIYLNINDAASSPFLFAIGQPTDTIIYNADDQVTLELEMALTNLDLTANFVFAFTQATEISEHNTDPAAHTEIITALKKAGIFLTAGAFPFERRGQNFEGPVEFDGTKPTAVHGGVTFTATYNGTEVNGQNLVFDGALTADEVRAVFNAANYPNTVEHDGAGTEVLAVATVPLLGGTYVVQELDVVYKDVDNVYKQALADGTIKSKIAGVARRADKCISANGFQDIDTGFAIGTNLFLSGTTPGALVNFDTNVNAGLVLGDFIYFSGYTGDISTNVSQEFDAVVTNSTGVGQFLTTQEAIDFVPSDGRILVDKLETLKATILTNSKNLSIVVNGPDKGWTRFAGVGTSWRIDFDAVPTQGTFRIEWDLQETNDMPFNATASAVEAEFNLLNGHNGFTVTGDYVSGFTFTSNDLDTYPLPTFVFAGTNEIQRFDFSNVPDDGTVTFEHKAQQTLNFPWDDLASDLKIALENLSTVQNVVVTGEFATQFFQIEYDGGYLEDGLQEQPLMQVIQTDLDLAGATTDINGTTVLPIDASVVQKGKKAASNLFIGTSPVTISIANLLTGEVVGPETAMIIDSENLSISGLGQMSNFTNGIILDDPATKVTLDMYFPNTTCPVETENKLPGIDYDFDINGYAKDVFSQLRITEHPTNKKRVVISGADQILASGITLSQELNSLLLDFDGAQIDFSADPIEIFQADGTTPLGLNSTMPTIAPDLWRWFSINIIPELSNADTSIKGQVLILPATTDGATKEVAEKAPFGDKPLGVVAIQGALGNKEKTLITTVKDVFSNLVGKAMTLYSPAESVAFWFSDPSLDTLNVEATTSVTGVDENIFNSLTNQALAGRITVPGAITVDKINLYLRKIGAPTGTVDVRILGDNAGVPDFGNVIATGTASINMTAIGTNYITPIIVDLGGPVAIGAGDVYVEVDGDNYVFSAGNFLAWQAQGAGSNLLFNRDPAVSSWSTDNPLRTVGIELIETVKGYPAIATAADREVEITTLVENDLQSVVATKLHAAIDGDVQFNASVTTNKIVVENATLGDVTDADVGDTGFFALVQTQGTDTDATGIEDISNKNIHQLGTGSGGGGSGDALDTKTRFQMFLDDSCYSLGAFNSFEQELPLALVNELNSTGKFGIVSKTYDIELAEKLQTLELTDFDSINEHSDIYSLAVKSYWLLASIDPSAIHRASRMGGIAGTFQTLDMSRVGLSDTLAGVLDFEEEKLPAVLSEQTLDDATAVDLDDGTARQTVSQEVVVGATTDISHYNFYLGRTGDFEGKFNVVMVADDGSGDPDLSAIIAQRGFYDVSELAVGETLVRLDINKELVAGTYHFVVLTDATYKTNYADGVTEMRVFAGNDGGLPNVKSYDGSAFSSAAGSVTMKYNLGSQTLILQTIEENPLANNDGSIQLNDTVQLQVGQPITWTDNRVTFKQLTLEINKNAAGATGTMIAKIVGDDGSGNPDLTNVLVYKSYNIDDLNPGINPIVVSTGDVPRSSGTAHMVIETDQVYKDHFNGTPADFISLRADTSPALEAGIAVAQTYNGSVWSATTDTAAGFLLEGRILSLVLEIESTIAEAKLSAFGVGYEDKPGVVVATTSMPTAFTTIQPTTSEVRIDLSSMAPLNRTFLEAKIQDGKGQVFSYPEFDIQGNEVVFEAGVFDVPNAVPIKFVQFQPDMVDANPALIELMRENFLGGFGPLDFAYPGRGPKMRAADGIMVELQITAAPRTIKIVDQE